MVGEGSYPIGQQRSMGHRLRDNVRGPSVEKSAQKTWTREINLFKKKEGKCLRWKEKAEARMNY